MRLYSSKSGLLAAAIALLCTAAPASAQAPGSSGTVVARVGSRTITAQDLDRRIANVPPFQLKSFGRTPEEVRRNFLERVLVREALFAEGARADRLAELPEVDERIRNALKSATLAKIRLETTVEGITDDEVSAYYAANRAKFHAPPRIALWRILVASADEAAAIIAEAQKDLTPKRWNELAREKSLDKATAMRGGNLGFVAPDGSTAEAGVKVDPALLVAAIEVKDAELVPRPVKEGDRWAVVWRRQSMKAVARSLEQEGASIRQVLAHNKTEDRIKAVVANLRKDVVTEVQPEAVEQLDITSSGEIQPSKRPGALPASRRPGAAPGPVPGPGGLR
jgi:peptidyl-prolyl cis-trans isomerase C